MDLPDIKGRKEVFQLYLNKLKIDGDAEEFSKRLASLTAMLSGADIANICNEGALFAARSNRSLIVFKDFEDAIERVIGGIEKRSRVLSVVERTRVAYHEAGHAIAGWFLEYANPLLKVSIVPRGLAALGYAQLQPIERNLYTPNQLDDMICVTLAGRAAEQLFFGNISTGALDDLQKVTNMIMTQVVELGMNEQVGSISYNFQKEPSYIEKPFSEQTAEVIDEEVRKSVIKLYERTLHLISEKKDLVEKVAKRLLQQEVLKVEDMIELVGPRPFPQASTYDEILRASQPDQTNSLDHVAEPVVASPSTVEAVVSALHSVDSQQSDQIDYPSPQSTEKPTLDPQQPN